MPYMNVKEESKDKLILCRNPSAWSWSILISSVVLAIGASIYGTEWIVLKVVLFLLVVGVGISSLEDWETCEFDRQEGHFKLARMNLMQYLLRPNQPQPVVTSHLNAIQDVYVSTKHHQYHGEGKQVVLRLADGISLGITESVSYDNRIEHEAIVEKIKSFLDIKPDDIKPDDITQDAESNPESDDDSSDASFEQVNIDNINGDD